MTSRTAPLTLGAVVALSLIGCTPAPAPTPEPTPAFSSEAEAFAAAEETYRAYVDALNRVDLSDPETFEDVYAWTTGDTNAEARSTFSEMHADQLTVSGESTPTLVAPRTEGAFEPMSVDLDVCLDVSDVRLVDRTGKSVVSPNRPDIQSARVTVAATTSTSTGWAVTRITGREGAPVCG